MLKIIELVPALSVKIAMLLYVRSIHESNFQLYMESLSKSASWMFTLDHTHYARWLPVHIQDTMLLSEKYSAILSEFLAGKFVVHRTHNKFSAMAIVMSREQHYFQKARGSYWVDDPLWSAETVDGGRSRSCKNGD